MIGFPNKNIIFSYPAPRSKEKSPLANASSTTLKSSSSTQKLKEVAKPKLVNSSTQNEEEREADKEIVDKEDGQTFVKDVQEKDMSQVSI